MQYQPTSGRQSQKGNNMKRWIHATSTYNDNTELLEIDVFIHYVETEVQSNSILDIYDSEFADFEGSLLDILDMYDYNLEDAYTSNRLNSNSKYYILTKTSEDGIRLRVFVKLRISDHEVPDRVKYGKLDKSKRRDSSHIKKEAKDFAKDRYGQIRGYRPRRIEIIFNDEHYTSYEEALRAIQEALDQFDKDSE